MSGPLKGKVALVTGSSRGIGKGIALVLAEQGATVYVTGRTVKEGDYYLPGTVGSTAAECDERGKESGGSGIAVACNHASDEETAALFERIEKEQGRLDILVNSATQLSEDLLEPEPFFKKPLSNLEMWDVGARSYYVCSWHAAKMMAKQKSGLIASISGFTGVTYTYGVVFSATKAIVDRITRDMAIELEPYNVATVSMWQGLTLTEKAKDNLARVSDKMTNSVAGQTGSSVEHPGRVIAAMAQDPNIMDRSGGTFITAELADAYGVVDIDGRRIESMREKRGSPLWGPIRENDYHGH
ncbi:MAG: SDR family NAD(P)-dependent oxidoreductase [Sphingomonadaceae bacterium]